MIRAALLCLLLLPVTASAADRPKLAVLDLEAKGVDVATAQTLTDVVAATLKKLEVFEVISRGDIQRMLSFEESKQLVGCTSSSDCVAEIGGALGVAKVVTGSVGKLGASYVITLTLIDTKVAKVIERESREVKSAEELSTSADAAAKFLVRSLLEKRPGELIVELAENGAEVELDGRLFGLTPLGRVKVASGPHTLRVSKKGFVSVARDVIVDDKEPTIVSVSLVPSPDFIDDYDRVANGLRGGAYAAGGAGAAMVLLGVVLRVGYNDRQVARLDADLARYRDLSAAAQEEQRAGLNQRMAAAEQTDQAALALMISGSVLVVAGIVVLFVGPKPGRYDQYKAVSVGNAKLSFDVSGARLSF